MPGIVSQWQQAHLHELQSRLEPLRALPDGLVYEQSSGLHYIRVIKQAGQLQFYFYDPVSGGLDGPMSRIVLERPLHLVAEYMQAAMLSLLWQPKPERMCVLGFAGGRLSLVFYHYFPEMIIENVDIDPLVAAIAGAYYGITFDARQTITIQDARAYIEQADGGNKYDILIMDAFGDGQENLNHLATVQFYQSCCACLSPDGVIAINLLKSDPLLAGKSKAIVTSFRHTLVSEHKRSFVLFGSQQNRFTSSGALRRAEQLQQQHRFDFPFVEHAQALQPWRVIEEYLGRSLRQVQPLEDM